MRISLVLALALFLAACGSSKPDTEEPTNTTEEPTTTEDPGTTEEPAVVAPEECEAAGGQVAWDIGDGNVQCPAGTFESSKVSGGVEPGLCCQPTPPDAE
jgi:hypothetical protein